MRDINAMTPLERLALWRDLHAIRGQDIAAARAEGHTWSEISAATGLSRQAADALHRAANARTKGDF